jgi:hypothetical protein
MIQLVTLDRLCSNVARSLTMTGVRIFEHPGIKSLIKVECPGFFSDFPKKICRRGASPEWHALFAQKARLCRVIRSQLERKLAV